MGFLAFVDPKVLLPVRVVDEGFPGLFRVQRHGSLQGRGGSVRALVEDMEEGSLWRARGRGLWRARGRGILEGIAGKREEKKSKIHDIRRRKKAKERLWR